MEKCIAEVACEEEMIKAYLEEKFKSICGIKSSWERNKFVPKIPTEKNYKIQAHLKVNISLWGKQHMNFVMMFKVREYTSDRYKNVHFVLHFKRILASGMPNKSEKIILSAKIWCLGLYL